MKGLNHKLTMFWLLLVLVLAVVAIPVPCEPVAAEREDSADEMTEFELSTRGTFLRADPYQGGGGSLDLPVIVPLQASGIYPLDNIMISFNGQINVDAGWNPVEPVIYKEVTNLVGVFSTSAELLPYYEMHRVPGAIEPVWDYVNPRSTSITFFGELPTDISEDFKISPKTGLWLQVPRNAQYLFICFADVYYYDNMGAIKVTIEKDKDGDGLLDSWELYGIDLDKDGTVDLDLPMLDADWEHKDIFVEADYMSGRAPNQEAINDVKRAFANAPVSNPDGVNGINLHVMIDESVPAMGLLSSFDEYYLYKGVHFGTEDERANPTTVEAKKLVFRYCMFANKIWFNPPNYDCPGVGELLGDDFILAFGAFTDGGTRDEQAAVFMHELGHTLGLRHGGDVDANYKPNYLSIMNYAFQYNSWKPTRPLDYSHDLCIDLNETSLDETTGIGISEVTVWRGPDGRLFRSNGALAINWNNNSVLEANVQVNLNNHSNALSPADEVLTDFDDWGNLAYRFRGERLFLQSATPEDYHIELTAAEIEQMRQEPMVVFSSPDDQSDTGWMIYVAAGAGIAIIAAGAVLWYRRKHS